MPVLKFKTVFGSVAYVQSDELEKAQLTGRNVRMCDKDGNPKYVAGDRSVYALGNLLTETHRAVVAYNPCLPGEPAGRHYWYADDMLNGLPAWMTKMLAG